MLCFVPLPTEEEMDRGVDSDSVNTAAEITPENELPDVCGKEINLLLEIEFARLAIRICV